MQEFVDERIVSVPARRQSGLPTGRLPSEAPIACEDDAILAKSWGIHRTQSVGINAELGLLTIANREQSEVRGIEIRAGIGRETT